MLFDRHDRDLELFSKGIREVPEQREIAILEFRFVLGAVLCGIRSSLSRDSICAPCAVEAQSHNHCITKKALEIRF